MKQQNPKFITVEGIEGVGKSTCLTYITEFLKERSIEFIQTREPGGTVIAEVIRKVMLNHYNETMCHDTELLLAFAGRAQHLETVIRPALKNNTWVLCDRFTDATYAYQGGGRQIAKDRIKMLENWLHPDLQPDLTLLLHAPVEVALERARGRGALDRIELEQNQFFERVQNVYLELAKEHPQRYRCIDANMPPHAVKAAVVEYLNEFIRIM